MLGLCICSRLRQSAAIEKHGIILERLIVMAGSISCSSRSISSTETQFRRGPQTVGIPAWARAAVKRRKSLNELLKPKTKSKLEAEIKLENRTKELDFYTSTMRGVLKDWKTVSRPEIVLSRDEKTIICYHPFVNHHPHELTEEPYERPYWYDDTDDYSDKITDVQAKELTSLRQKDPKLWSVRPLTHLFQVNPKLVLKIQLTDDQKKELEDEKEFLSELPEQDVQRYKYLHHLERVEYIKETRGDEMARQSKEKMW